MTKKISPAKLTAAEILLGETGGAYFAETESPGGARQKRGRKKMIIKVSAITGAQLHELETIADDKSFKFVLQKPHTWSPQPDQSGSCRCQFPTDSVLKFLDVKKSSGDEPTYRPRYNVTLEIAEFCWMASDDKIKTGNWGDDYAYGYRRHQVHIKFVLKILAILDRFMSTRTLRDYAWSTTVS